MTVDSLASKPSITRNGAHGLRSSFSATHALNFIDDPMVSMSEMPGYEWPTFIMIKRSVRPMATFTCDTDPGPSAHTPEFIPIASAIGPLTITIGACGPVDIAKVRKPMVSSSTHSAIARITGIAFGAAPAITALAAIFSTVPMPIPGANTPTTSAAARPDAATIASTFARVGGTSGSPSLQPLLTKRAFIASKQSRRLAPSNVMVSSAQSVRCSNTGRARSAVGVVVRPSITCPVASSTICAMCTGSPLVNGNGATANGRSGQPNTSAEKRASSSKPTATQLTVGSPRSSNAAISRMSQLVHDPQSAVVPTSTSHSARIFCFNGSDAYRVNPPLSPR